MEIVGSPMRIFGSPMKRQVGSPMKRGLRWVSDDDDFFPDSLYRAVLHQSNFLQSLDRLKTFE